MRHVLMLAVVGACAVLAGAGTAAAQGKVVGPDKCAKMCHKVELASWRETKHAKAEKPTECETCHGPGSGYLSLSVKKDPAKAKAAGLIAKPELKSCAAAGCHKEGEATAEMVEKVHLRKAKKG